VIPYHKIYYFDSVREFSLDKLKAIPGSFHVSLLVATIRYCQICVYELMIVIFENNIVKWYGRNEHFPKWPFRFKVHGQLPPTTLAGVYFTKADNKFTSRESINPDDWFYVFTDDFRADRKMYEQSF